MDPRPLRRRWLLCLIVAASGLPACGDGGAVPDGGLQPPGTRTTTTTSTRVPPACPGPISCYPSNDLPNCPEILPKTVTFSFDPNDARWVEDYQTCLDQAGGLIRPTECDWFCADAAFTNATVQAADRLGEASIDCSRPERPTLTVVYYESHCDPPPP